ncbi:ABC transporter ATP-binding protein [Humisphaera borealis]|uniref:ABC transporter ATP-binding protein n=1 Tax=Humisphaera borealis TaxID=2807512 RepID=A0A7M2X2E6_9BACT|nr:ABC transporter ATP-binding protein [Humisphaera borealis]QOV91844.1 ABC transporter ATP-binding protein [Humisphaera borealis]
MTSNGQPAPATPPGSPDATSGPGPGDKPKPRKGTREFWRAMRFVWPYRRTILISITCAFFVGLAASASLAAITPVLRVLLNNQTVQQWVDASVVEKRLGVRLLEDSAEMQVVEVRDGVGKNAGLLRSDRIRLLVGGTGGIPEKSAPKVIAALAHDGGTGTASTVPVQIIRGEETLQANLALAPVPVHLRALQDVVSHISSDPVWAIAQIFGALALLAVFGNTLKFFQEYLSDKVAVTAVHDIRRKLYDHILHVPMSHFGRHGTSDVTSRLVQDSAALEIGFKTVLGQSVQQPIVAAMAFGVAMLTSWKLTLVIVIFAPLMGAVIQRFGKKMRRAARAAFQKNSTMLGQISGTLNGVRVVKSASAERWERRRYRAIMLGLRGEQLRMSKLEAAGSPIMETITLMVVGIIVLIATYMVTKTHSLSVTEFFVVMACLGTIGDSMRRLNKVNGVLQRANAAATRIFEVIALPVERRRELVQAGTEARRHEGTKTDIELGASRPIKLRPLQHEVRFENLTFTYPGAASPALVDVSLAVAKGTRVAVVGRNGSGKTTLLALLPRFYEPDSGRVTIDGIDISIATLRSLRGQISLVTQDSVIFAGTIAENIAYGHPMARLLRSKQTSPAATRLRQEIESAARRAFAHDFIMEKGAGYDTFLDGLGGQLSGGQKQRLCIARAILRNAPILILDEATSQVDAESEHLIQQAVDDLMHEGHDPVTGVPTSTAPTTFVIAHRFSTIMSADVIVVMEKGQIVGKGKHDELMRTCEVYQQLSERQLIAAPV